MLKQLNNEAKRLDKSNKNLCFYVFKKYQFIILRFRINNQITIGAPKIEVTALIGKDKSLPGSCEILSQINIIIAPKSKVLQNKMV